MKRVVKVRLLPTEVESAALAATLTACNAAAAWLSTQFHRRRVRNKIDAQRLFYAELRQRFGLSAQLAIRVIGKVADAYSSQHTKIISAILDHSTRGVESEYATVDIPEVPPADPVNGFVGVDLGMVNIATTSDGDRVTASRLNRYRRRQETLQKRLQAKRTRSARRLLRKRRRRERRFAADINHRISKSIVAEAKRTGRGIAIEQLGGIRERVRFRKPQRAALHWWAFDQLGRFLGYKAQAAGVAFVRVNPAYTSQTCSACGYIDKGNRRSQSVFDCAQCDFVGHADHNAANNIAMRGVARWGEVMRPHAAPTLAAS